MQKQAPKLVIMAAGMGSRFGGLKQMEPVDREGHSIIDFSMYDARRAGFRDLVFIIKREHEALFRERIGTRMERFFHVEYVYQELTDIPAGYSVPDGRVKPWARNSRCLLPERAARAVRGHQLRRFLRPHGVQHDL